MASQPFVVQPTQLARQTRQRFLSEIAPALAELGAALAQRLSELQGDGASEHDVQTRRDAWSAYQLHQSAWVDGTLKAWQAALHPTVAKASDVPTGFFELVGTDAMDDQIIASRLGMQVSEKLGTEADDLQLRVKHLEGSDNLSLQDILRPEVLLLIMVQRWTSAGLAREAWALVNDLACTLLTARLQQAYASGNAFLIQQGVLPTIDFKDRVKRSPATASRSGAPAQGAEPAPARAAPGHGSESSTAGLKTPAGVGARQQAGAADDARPAQRSLAHAQQRAVGVMGQLKRLLLGAGAAPPYESTVQQLPSPALAAAIAAIPAPVRFNAGSAGAQHDDSPATVAWVSDNLRRISVDLKSKAQTKNEKATIEIVALMFQAILQESRIPAGIRVWFARLQMPVLREALASPDFFGTVNHPARLLIDRMGSCVMGFAGGSINGSALEAEIRRVVQVIEQYPETGQKVYQLVYDEFNRFLVQFLAERESTQKVVSVAQQVELKETLTIRYTIEMRNMLRDMPVRDEIREFLFKVWAEVLAMAAVRNGPQHDETLELKKSATDLVWAASAKPNRADRSRVIQELPRLLQKLRSGMTLLGLAPNEQERHITAVRDTLADAFLSKTQAISKQQIEAMTDRLAQLEDFVTDDDDADLPLDALSIEMMLGLDASNIDVVADGGASPTPQMLAWARELQIGAWFTLDHNARVAQVQFVWRSARQHLNLFASTDGRSYLIQAGRLAAYLQAGLLVAQEEEALTVRATRDALDKLQANPERLLA